MLIDILLLMTSGLLSALDERPKAADQKAAAAAL